VQHGSRIFAIRQPEVLREFTMAVAVRVLKWNLRSRWVRRRVLLSEDGDLPEGTADRSPEEETRDALRRCRRILDALGARERAAFSLRFMKEMTMEEVAATMHVSLSTAKRLCNRATAAIAERISAVVNASAVAAWGQIDRHRGLANCRSRIPGRVVHSAVEESPAVTGAH
jgi:DNA-directed RNA polymerase specialized sigma24 family protein